MQDKVKYVAVWFTFARDENLVRMSVASFQRLLPGTPCVIVDDISNPVGTGTRRTLEIMGCDYRQSEFNRGRNLRGTECIAGMLEVMNDACEQYGATHALKIDSDVLWNRATWLESVSSETTGIGTGSSERGWYGASYAIRSDTLPLIRHAVLAERWECCQPEDLTIYRHLLPYEPTRLIYSHDGGSYAGWLYEAEATESRFQLYLDRFDLISVGNRAPLSTKEDTMWRFVVLTEFPSVRHLSIMARRSTVRRFMGSIFMSKRSIVK